MSAAEDTPVSSAEALSLFGALSEFSVLILAVSGGPDSTALLWLAARWRQSLKTPPKLVAVTVDHGLRPESKAEALAVKRLARKLGVEHRTLRWTGRKPNTGIQAAARQARYGLLSEVALKVGARQILTAHTLDDQAETVLFRMTRGSGLAGLAGMAYADTVPVRGGLGLQIVRPFLGVPKSRLIATLKAAKVVYADDPSNRDPRFTRPRLRALMPALAREGLTAGRLVKLARRAEQAEDALWHATNDAQTEVSLEKWSRERPVRIAAQAYAQLPPELQLRLLGRAIDFKGNEGPVELGKLEAMMAALSELLEATGLNVPRWASFRRTLAGALVTLKDDTLTVECAPSRRSRAPKRP